MKKVSQFIKFGFGCLMVAVMITGIWVANIPNTEIYSSPVMFAETEKAPGGSAPQSPSEEDEGGCKC